MIRKSANSGCYCGFSAIYPILGQKRIALHTAADYSPGRYVFVRLDYANPRENTRHKLAPVATGPYRIVKSDADTILTQDGD